MSDAKFFPLPERPKYADALKFPQDITELTPANISELMGKYTEMYSYAAAEAAKAEVQLLILATGGKKVETDILQSRPELLHKEKWRKDLIINTDPQKVELLKKEQHWQIRLRYAKMFLEIYEKYLNALSRELTRKSTDTTQSINSLKRRDRLNFGR